MSTFNSDSHSKKTELGSDYTAYKQEILARQQSVEHPKVDIRQIYENFDKTWTSKQVFAGRNVPSCS